MLYRAIGGTGLEASIIGLGTEHLDHKPYSQVEPTIHAALDAGINIFDLFMPGEEVRCHIGRSLAGRRDKVMIQGHIGSVDKNGQYAQSRDLATCKARFEDLLRDLGTDYIDFGMLFFIDTDDHWRQVVENGILDYAKQLKQQGVIRAIGASSHNPLVARRLVETGEIELLMFSINPAFDMMPADLMLDDMFDAKNADKVKAGINPVRTALYQVCERQGVGITVMKSLGSGKLLDPAQTPFARPLSAAQCIHYALTRPAVASALVGCQTPAQVAEAVGYLELADAERDYTSVVDGYKGDFRGSCVYCNHCLPCPVGIDVASVNRYLDIALLDPGHIPPSIRQHYESLPAAGADCIACGACEGRCPFGVPVIRNMERAAELFGR